MENEIVLFESEDVQVKLNVEFDGETVWLTKEQMAALFGRDRSVISRHISNIFREGEILEEGNVHYLHIANSDKPVAFYNLDAIISVAYRVKSKRGVEFRRWATGVLRQYVLDGYAANKRRLAQLGKMAQVMDCIPNSSEAKGILSVVKAYTGALDLLDDYDHRRIAKPKGRAATYVLNYDECRSLIASMKFSRDSDLFGVEKDDSFRSSIAAIYQGFGGQEMYPTLEEKGREPAVFRREEPFVPRRQQAHRRCALPVFLEHERCVVGRWRQAYFRQRVGRAHHHDRRVEARRERGYGGIGYELPFFGVVRSAWRQEQDGARDTSDWAWPSCCMRRAIWPVLSIPLYTRVNETG